jgi:hypothetical protein
MIVSHTHRFVFVAVPKTGSQAVRAALRPLLGPYDWEQCDLFERRRFPVSALAAIGTGHLTCRELAPYLLPEMWRDYRRFAFVRDPFARFASLIRFWFPADGAERATSDACKRILSDPATRRRRLVRPQSDFLCDESGGLLVDQLGTYADLAGSFARILRGIGIEATPTLPMRNVSSRGVAEPEFDNELMAMIADFYHADFRLPGLSTQAAQVA